METEERLTIDWLQQRFEFDNAARDQTLLQQALQLLNEKPVARIADLGAGTGNNTLFLAPHLPEDCELTVVEQHDYLLQACQQRLSETQQILPGIRFVQQDLHQWLAETPPFDLICNSALLDLMTDQELAAVLQRLQALRTPMYSTLTYTGVEFLPGDDADALFIGLFEQHMSRKLDRGQPLGAGTVERTHEMCEKMGLALFSAPSSWQVTSADAAFLQMNLAFYQRGIETQLTAHAEKTALSNWLTAKHSGIDAGTLTLQVMHQDILIVP